MKVIKSKNIVSHCENGGYVILNINNGNFYGLYDISKDIWDMLECVQDKEEVVSRLIDKHSESSKEEIIKDVEAFLNDLKEEELVEIYE